MGCLAIIYDHDFNHDPGHDHNPDPDHGHDLDLDPDHDPDPDLDPDADLDPDHDPGHDRDPDPDADPDADMYFCLFPLILVPCMTQQQSALHIPGSEGPVRPSILSR